MSLLDILNQSGGSGLLSSLMYRSPLQDQSSAIEYDAMGNPIPKYTSLASPFPDLPKPAMAPVPQMDVQAPVTGFGMPFGGIGGYQPQQAVAPQQQAVVAPQVQAPAAVGPDGFMQIGSYSMPQFGKPDPAILPTAAIATQAQQAAPQAQPQAQATDSPSFGNRLLAGFQGFANSGGPLPALSNLVTGLLTGERTDPAGVKQQSQKAIYNAAIANGLSRDKAFLVATNPKAFEAYTTQLFGPKNTPKNFEEAAVQEALANNKPGASASTALSEAQKKFEANKIEAEAAKKKAVTIAEKQGENAASLPDTLARAQETIKQIDEIANHPGKSWNTGLGSIVPPIPGSSGADFIVRLKQLKGGAFLDAYKMLRGTGAISEKEGAKAEVAQARLDNSVSEKDFNQNLADLREIVVRGYENAQKMAGKDNPEPYQLPVGQSRTINGVKIKRVD